MGEGGYGISFVFLPLFTLAFIKIIFFTLRKPFMASTVCKDYPESSGHVKISDLGQENMLDGIVYGQRYLYYFSSQEHYNVK